jgi:hypothetical protein
MKVRVLVQVVFLLAIIAGCGAEMTAQQAYLKAANADSSDEFGGSVAISGQTVVVGAKHEESLAQGVDGNMEDNSDGGSGAAYVFSISPSGEWRQEAYLKAFNNRDHSWFFGSSVAIFGDTIVVGAPSESNGAIGVNGNPNTGMRLRSGAAYVYMRDREGNWRHQAYLKASNPTVEDQFGRAVAICGDTIVVGAPGDDAGDQGLLSNYGAVYIFERNSRNTWREVDILRASIRDQEDRFGEAVAICEDTIVVGATGEDSAAVGVHGDANNNGAKDAGAVYTFKRGSDSQAWSQQAYLKASNSGSEDRFGSAVSIAGNTIVVGAPEEDSGAMGIGEDEGNDDETDSGAAYIFFRNELGWWSQEAYLKGSNTNRADNFGVSVGASGNHVIAGGFTAFDSTGVNGPQFKNNANAGGAAYLFVRDDTGAWGQEAYIKASNGNFSDRFGGSAAIDGDYLVVGDYSENQEGRGVDVRHDDYGSPSSGSAYIYKRGVDLEVRITSFREEWPFIHYSWESHPGMRGFEFWQSFDGVDFSRLSAFGTESIPGKFSGSYRHFGGRPEKYFIRLTCEER